MCTLEVSEGSKNVVGDIERGRNTNVNGRHYYWSPNAPVKVGLLTEECSGGHSYISLWPPKDEPYTSAVSMMPGATRLVMYSIICNATGDELSPAQIMSNILVTS